MRITQYIILLFMILFTTISIASNSSNAQITYCVKKIDALQVSHNTYSITTNVSQGKTKRIVAYLDSPSAVEIYVNVNAPSTGTSTGVQLLKTTPVTVVTDISAVNESNIPIQYTINNPYNLNAPTIIFSIADN